MSPAGKNNIAYFTNVIGDKELINEFRELLLELQKGENLREKRLELKKMPGYRIYSIRLNLADRLLFVELKGVLILVGRVNFHRYIDSVLRAPKLVDMFLETHKEQIDQAIESSAAASSSSGSRASSSERIHPEIEHWDDVDTLPEGTSAFWDGSDNVAFKYFNNKLFILEQSDINTIHAEMPVLITGAAGSGKTSNAMFIMQHAMNQTNPLNLEQAKYERIIYVSQSVRLVRTSQDIWSKHQSETITEPKPAPRVEFKTVNELIAEICPAIAARKPVTKEDFIAWYAKFCQKYQQQQRTPHKAAGQKYTGKKNTFFLDATLIRQEMRIAAGLGKEKYMGLGKKQSALPPSSSADNNIYTSRQFALQALEAWNNHLNNKNLADPPCMDLASYIASGSGSEENMLIVFDEAQKHSLAEHKALYIKSRGNIAFSAGEMQQKEDNLSCIPALIALPGWIENSKRQMQHIELPKTHRVPPVILPFVNTIVAIELSLNRGGSFKGQFARLSCNFSSMNNPGGLYWLDDVSEEHRKLLQAASKNTDCFIITHEHHIVEARTLFPDALILTEAEATGLEAETVILFNILDEASIIKASRAIPDDFQMPKEHLRATVNRPGKDLQHPDYNTAINGLYIAATRGHTNLVVLNTQKKSTSAYRLEAILKRESLPKTSLNSEFTASTAITREIWEARILELYDIDLKALSCEFYMRKFNTTEEEFTTFINEKGPISKESNIEMGTCSSSSSSRSSGSSSSSSSSSVVMNPHLSITPHNKPFDPYEKLRKAFEINNVSTLRLLSTNINNSKKVTYWLTKPVNQLGFLSISWLFKQLNPKQKYGTSLFSWFFKSKSPENAALFLELLEQNDTLRKEFAELILKKKPLPNRRCVGRFDPQLVDLVLIADAGKFKIMEEILQKIANKLEIDYETLLFKSGLNVPWDVVNWIYNVVEDLKRPVKNTHPDYAEYDDLYIRILFEDVKRSTEQKLKVNAHRFFSLYMPEWNQDKSYDTTMNIIRSKMIEYNHNAPKQRSREAELIAILTMEQCYAENFINKIKMIANQLNTYCRDYFDNSDKELYEKIDDLFTDAISGMDKKDVQEKQVCQVHQARFANDKPITRNATLLILHDLMNSCDPVNTPITWLVLVLLRRKLSRELSELNSYQSRPERIWLAPPTGLSRDIAAFIKYNAIARSFLYEARLEEAPSQQNWIDNPGQALKILLKSYREIQIKTRNEHTLESDAVIIFLNQFIEFLEKEAKNGVYLSLNDVVKETNNRFTVPETDDQHQIAGLLRIIRDYCIELYLELRIKNAGQKPSVDKVHEQMPKEKVSQRGSSSIGSSSRPGMFYHSENEHRPEMSRGSVRPDEHQEPVSDHLTKGL